MLHIEVLRRRNLAERDLGAEESIEGKPNGSGLIPYSLAGQVMA